MAQVSDVSFLRAVELAKAGMQMSNGYLINAPEAVPKFLEIVATKIESLKHGHSQP
jgi:hypothetical protein